MRNLKLCFERRGSHGNADCFGKRERIRRLDAAAARRPMGVQRRALTKRRHRREHCVGLNRTGQDQCLRNAGEPRFPFSPWH